MTLDLGPRKGAILGDKASYIKEVEKETKAKITTSKTNNSVTFSGSPKAKQEAYDKLKARLESVVDYFVPSHMERILMGNAGQRMQKIHRSSGAGISRGPAEGGTTFFIAGESEQIQKAKDMFEEVLNVTLLMTSVLHYNITF